MLVDHNKVEVVTTWKPSSNVSDIQSFLGLTGYYRRFTENVSHIATPLTRLLCKGAKLIWSESFEQIF